MACRTPPTSRNPAAGAHTSDRPSMDMERFSLDGKVAVVTGASRGIGAALAQALADAGAAVALLGRDAQALGAVQAALTAQGLTITRVTADVGDNSSIDAAFDTVLRS